ncbi:Stp1/IreP family PP2C-type Ser/Thr phosphatase [Halalkalibacter urbisdiaboli]|uniref:Stp1/IreP family PP2C-type Ser/Thr phosphatase n=1 Tax=Halalkalibacter urbisdiaboli TaxID=1960589 RepID=UPI000B42EA9F|nr:Stp1/IreP family PP2C-type Ser/Thr phosphatase [Halalkalibacter urbisdiaboli]
MEKKFTFRTDVGQVRSHNEDNGGIFTNQIGILAVVADGMGGHRAGDVASSMTITLLKEAWEQHPALKTVVEAETWLKEQFTLVNDALFQHASEHEECQGMGTTLVAAICTDDFITIGHIGDSRAYLSNEYGFSVKTDDHSLVHELVRTGQISEEEAEHHPRKNVLLRALGTERDIKIDILTLQADEYQTLMLCSDGLSNKLTTDEMNDVLQGEGTLEQKADSFIKIANERGGEDNISVALIQYLNESKR